MHLVLARPVYSPLCDTDTAVYSQYLSSFVVGSPVVGGDGTVSVDGGVGGFGGGGREVGCCCGDAGHGFVVDVGIDNARETKRGSLGLVGNLDGGDGAGSGSVGIAAEPDSDGAVGFPGVHDSSDVGVLAGGCANGESRETADKTGDVGETKLERNRRWRRNKRDKKRLRREAGVTRGGVPKKSSGGSVSSQENIPEWRRKDDVGSRSTPVLGSGRVGYFSRCAEDVQRELCDSRAAVLVARNKRELAEEKTKLARLASPEALVKAVAYAVSVGERLKKQTVNSKIGGWAETVVDSMVESVVRSAPSSVPSLESVGYGKSAVSEVKEKEPEDGGIAAELRKTQYALAMATLEASCDAMPYVPGPYYDDEVEKIRREYADVVESPEVAMKSKFVDELLEVYEGNIPDVVLKKMVKFGWIAASDY